MQQREVGESLGRLKIARDQIDTCLVETEEFNERILNPEVWQAKLRIRQLEEMKELQQMRDDRKI